MNKVPTLAIPSETPESVARQASYLAQSYDNLAQEDKSFADDIWDTIAPAINAKLADHGMKYVLDSFFPQRHAGSFVPHQTFATRLTEIIEEIKQDQHDRDEAHYHDMRAYASRMGE